VTLAGVVLVASCREAAWPTPSREAAGAGGGSASGAGVAAARREASGDGEPALGSDGGGSGRSPAALTSIAAPGAIAPAGGRLPAVSPAPAGGRLPAVSPTPAGGRLPAVSPTPAGGRLPAVPSTPATAARVRHVIIISEDGLRPDALLLAHGPVMAEVMKHAAYSLTAMTIRHASTLPSHGAMLSGFDEEAHGVSWNTWRPGRGSILVPTIFDAAGRAGQSSAAFVGKQKLEHVIPPASVGLFSRPGFLCHAVSHAAAQYFVERRPTVEFVHFADPDEIGHHQGWMSDEQIQAIRGADQCVANMIDAVHRAGADADTLFILSADHGGHGKNHTGRIKEDRLIPWIAWGAGIHPHKLASPVSTMDTAATALWALGLPRPLTMEGHPVEEAFGD